MEMNAEQKRNVVFAFTNVLRTSTLAGQVDIQRTVAGFAAYLDQLPPDQPIPLQPLYDGMLQAQLPQPAVDAGLWQRRTCETGAQPGGSGRAPPCGGGRSPYRSLSCLP